MSVPPANSAIAAYSTSALVGAALIFGGAMGYARKGSFASLMAGGVSGASLILGAKLTHNGNPDGAIVAMVVSGALAAMMGRKYLDSKAPLPGAIAGLSLITLVVNALYWFTL